MKFFIFILLSVMANSQCPNDRIYTSTPCYGECGNFIDENGNGICDTWEKYQKEKQSSYQKNKDRVENNTSKLKKYGLIYILVINIALLIISEIFYSNSNTARLLWNWILLISSIATSLSGFFLYFGVMTQYRENLFSLHIQSACVFFITSIYHTLKRLRGMI